MSKAKTSPAQLFLARLKDLKKAVGPSWFYVYTGLDTGLVSRWLAGKTTPTEESILRVEKNLRASLIQVTTHQKGLQNAVPTFDPTVTSEFGANY